MSAILAGLSGPVWGTGTQSYIILDNIQESAEVQETPLQDNADDHVAVAFTAQKGELTMDFAVTTPASAPYPGQASLLGHTISISDSGNFAGQYFVKSVTRTRKRGDWMRGTLTASRFPTTFSTTTTTTGA